MTALSITHINIILNEQSAYIQKNSAGVVNGGGDAQCFFVL